MPSLLCRKRFSVLVLKKYAETDIKVFRFCLILLLSIETNTNLKLAPVSFGLVVLTFFVTSVFLHTFQEELSNRVVKKFQN